MNALTELEALLSAVGLPNSDLYRSLADGCDALVEATARLEQRFQESDGRTVSEDQVRASLRQFVAKKRLDSLRDARHVCFGLTLPILPGRSCLFDDPQLFSRVISRDGGIDQWVKQPRAFRRCFRGLAASYFTFDGSGSHAVSLAGHKNWLALRNYLRDRVGRIQVEGRNPDWVTLFSQRAHVFSDAPFGDLPRIALSGNQAMLREIFDAFLIDGQSWFRRDLLLAQVRYAAGRKDAEFIQLLERLIKLIEGSLLIRDEALAVILERYMKCSYPIEHKALRDISVDWWGNPWLPSTELQWGRVSQSTRESVARWLHKEFIDAFFSKLADDSEGDRRRARFWSRYIGIFKDMKFGLSRRTLYSEDPDFKKLIARMEGLYGPIEAAAAGGDAFIMTLGNLVIVEFSSYSNAMYAYNARSELPFVVAENVQLRTAVNARNSLKHHEPRSVLRLRHQDDVLGYGRWEDRFADQLKRYGILAPTVGDGRLVALPEDFYTFARTRNLKIEDLRGKGGNLWVYVDESNAEIAGVLRNQKFTYRPGKGWWKG